METTHEIKSFTKIQRLCTKKMIEHFQSGPLLTEKEFLLETKKTQNLIRVDYLILHINTLVEKDNFAWNLIISAYDIQYVFFRRSKKFTKNNNPLNDLQTLYSYYEQLYKDPSTRIEMIFKFGPLLSFEEFKKRKLAGETFK